MSDLNLKENNAKQAAADMKKKASPLDSAYPWLVLPFNPEFFGIPQEITHEDLT
jgi:hypothetical protein